VAAGLLGLSVVLVTLIARRITSPMEALYQTAHRVAQGQFDRRAPEVGPMEVAEVAAGFNHMLNRIPAFEQTLRDSEARHRSLVEMAPDGIVVQKDGAIVYANPGFRRMFGLDDEATLAGLSLTDFAPPGDHGRMVQDMGRLANAPGSQAAAETTLVRRDGQPIDVELASSSVRVQDHIIVQSHLSELTARNQARRDLEQANELLESRIQQRTEALQTANDALASFSYSVAHDLRAPLRSIDGFTHLMASAVARGEPEKAARYLDRVIKNTRAMGQMIEGLLKLAHTGHYNLDMVPVDMQALVEEVLTETGGRDHTTITVDALPAVSADGVMLHQVWTNLISNALKYSVRHPHPEVRVGCETVGAEHVFSISDNGTGFDPADASKLFGVFQRLPGATEFDGTGVGLAIVKRIVERHGGRVWAEGRPGEGATFYFALPVSRPD
jgi:PAS domain S-box-containing protein